MAPELPSHTDNIQKSFFFIYSIAFEPNKEHGKEEVWFVEEKESMV